MAEFKIPDKKNYELEDMEDYLSNNKIDISELYDLIDILHSKSSLIPKPLITIFVSTLFSIARKELIKGKHITIMEYFMRLRLRKENDNFIIITD
jgi:hypothetical protein